jgi:hypothetical protein
MTTAIVVLLVVAALVAFLIVRPGRPYPSTSAVDRDRERQLAELRALADYREDVRLR